MPARVEMSQSEVEHPRVFISYSHDSKVHMDRVLKLSDKLRKEGVDCFIDRYEEAGPPEGWPRWMAAQIKRAKFVLVICTADYERRFLGEETSGKGLGATWEGAVITQDIYDAQGNNSKFIPLLFAPEDANTIPGVLKSVTRYMLYSEEGYEKLYRRLTNQPQVQIPALGQLRPMPLLKHQEDFESTGLSDRSSEEQASSTNSSTNQTTVIRAVGTVIPSHCNYSDISPTDDYYYAVQHLCAIGAVTGYADGTFRPESNMTRGQFAKIISNTLEFTGDSGGQIFEDVPPSNTFFEWINRLAERNIVRGYACGTIPSEPCVPSSNKPYFRPFDDLAREQLCEIIIRAGVWPTNSTGGPHFRDVPLSNPFFQYVETAYNNGIISPLEDSIFGFGSPATRGQVCSAVYKGIVINEKNKNAQSKSTRR